jgi:8-oxo-dGTP pyrophosphatase MutT (NUDIX family)
MRIKKSYGIGCCRYNTKRECIEILMIKKRNTFAFTDFIYGKYKPTDDNRIISLFDKMTCMEKLDILSMDFGWMWYRIWLVNPESIGTHIKLPTECYEKYLRLKNHFNNTFAFDNGVRLRKLLSLSRSSDSIWELPKGRINTNESPFLCAIREFEEETNIPVTEYDLFDDYLYSQYIQTGKVRYEQYYYLAFLHSDSNYHNPRKLKSNYNIPQQVSEVIDIQWIDLNKLHIIDPCGRLHGLVRSMMRALRHKFKLKRLTELSLI